MSRQRGDSESSRTHELPTLLFESAQDEHLQSKQNGDCKSTLAVRRPLFTRVHFEQTHEPSSKQHRSLRQKALGLRARVRCNRAKCVGLLRRLLPFIGWLKVYDVRGWLLLDIVCGLTIGIINVPQSMGYALLSGVEPLYGLYSSFVPPLLYVFFGTSRNMCYGTLAVTSLLVGSVVMKTSAQIQQSGAVPAWVFQAAEACDTNNLASFNDSVNGTLGNSTDLLYQGMTPKDFVRDLHARIAICLCFLTGIFQLLIGIFRLGFLTIYFADAMMAGYTCATMIYAFVSQLKYLFGIHFVRPTGPLNIIYTIVLLFKHIGETNIATLVTSIISCGVLLIFKYAINDKIMRKTKAPIPGELLVVIAGILASVYLDMGAKWKVDSIGAVRAGLPMPRTPDFALLPELAGEGLVVSLVNFGVSIALASVLARKHKNDIDESQEAVSYGICNLVSSFFQSIPTGGAVASTCVEESMNGKTQLVGLLASCIMVIVLAFLTHLFSALPISILSAIIVVGLMGMIDRFSQVKHLWKVSKFDCAIWLSSFIGTVLLDVDLGLMFSILSSFFILVVRSQASSLYRLGNIPNTDIYEPTKTFKSALEIPEIKILRLSSPINFANSSMVRKALYKKCGTHPLKSQRQTDSSANSVSASDSDTNNNDFIAVEKQQGVRYIILDMASCTYIDFSGLRIVKQVITDFMNIGIVVLLCGCNMEVRRILKNSDFYTVCDPQRLFITVHDAVLAAQRNLVVVNDKLKAEIVPLIQPNGSAQSELNDNESEAETSLATD